MNGVRRPAPGVARRGGAATIALLALLLSGATPPARAEAPVPYRTIPGGVFDSAVPADGRSARALLRPFALRETPVSNGEFLAFVQSHPQWRRDAVPALFADAGYLRHWLAPLQLGPSAGARQPVTNVSWFAARAYCAAEQARLPNWYEWEYVAAADAQRADAREDPLWQARTLDWYARPATAALPAVGGEANLYGVRDLNGVIWEWVEDYNALLAAPDSRDSASNDRQQFCGAAALQLRRTDEYAVQMRIALLSSLQAHDTTATLGFRCARDIHPAGP